MSQPANKTHVLRLPAASSLDSVRAALARLESCEALLVFPQCGVPALTQPQVMAALRAFCREQEIDTVFVGGDEALRAVAVTEGFAAATSLDAWQSFMLDEPAPFGRPSPDDWAAADAQLVAASLDHSDDGAGWHADPPEYVLRLLGSNGGYAGPRDEPTPQEAARLLTEDGASDPLLRAHHDYEERMTATIRDTGRLPMWQPAGR